MGNRLQARRDLRQDMGWFVAASFVSLLLASSGQPVAPGAIS